MDRTLEVQMKAEADSKVTELLSRRCCNKTLNFRTTVSQKVFSPNPAEEYQYYSDLQFLLLSFFLKELS
jgi:hypothetical protein